MRLNKLVSVLALFSTVSLAYEPPKGAIDPRVTQDNLAITVCVSGYTGTVRPPVSYTNAVKKRMIKAPDQIKDFELDHYIPLAVGGNPTSLDNLFLQAWGGPDRAHTKDKVEADVHRQLCKGKLTLKQAQDIFTNGWQKYKRN